MLHNGKVFTYGYDGDGNLIWRTHAAYPLVKPPVDKDERLEDPAAFPGYNKNQDKNEDKGSNGNNGKGKETTRIEVMSREIASLDISSLSYLLVKNDNSNSGGNSGSNGNSGNNGNGNNGNNGQGNDKDNKGQGQLKENGKGSMGYDKNLNAQGKGWAKGQNKDNDKSKGRALGRQKNGKDPLEDKDLTNPEIFEVTNYINDISQEYTQVLMTTDIDDNYRAAYTYGVDGDRISTEDLMKVEGRPNNPLYYLQDALGSTIAITNMNAGIIDSNRFAPYGEPLDPVAKNARLTNSPFGYTGEMHDIEARLVYLRARHYDPQTMQFLQQDTVLGNIEDPLSRNLYMYAQGNPVRYTDPSGNMIPYDGKDTNLTNDYEIYAKPGDRGDKVEEIQGYLMNLNNPRYHMKDKIDGKFGLQTKTAVSNFKVDNGLYNSGVYEGAVDNKTLNALKNASANVVNTGTGVIKEAQKDQNPVQAPPDINKETSNDYQKYLDAKNVSYYGGSPLPEISKYEVVGHGYSIGINVNGIEGSVVVIYYNKANIDSDIRKLYPDTWDKPFIYTTGGINIEAIDSLDKLLKIGEQMLKMGGNFKVDLSRGATFTYTQVGKLKDYNEFDPSDLEGNSDGSFGFTIKMFTYNYEENANGKVIVEKAGLSTPSLDISIGGSYTIMHDKWTTDKLFLPSGKYNDWDRLFH